MECPLKNKKCISNSTLSFSSKELNRVFLLIILVSQTIILQLLNWFTLTAFITLFSVTAGSYLQQGISKNVSMLPSHQHTDNRHVQQLQLVRHYYLIPSGVGGDQNTAKRRVNGIGLTLIRGAQQLHLMNANVIGYKFTR